MVSRKLYYYYYLKGDYERALEFRRLHPDQQTIHAYIEYIPIYGQLGIKQKELENWHKLQAEEPGWTAESFEDWWRLWNFRDEDVAKLMEASLSQECSGRKRSPASDPGCALHRGVRMSALGH